MIELREYVDRSASSAFSIWVDGLTAQAAAKVATALERMKAGNFSNVAPVGEGVSEYKLHWGPGYRIYFGQDGATVVILVGGGSKQRQSADIRAAKIRWAEYKLRKKEQV